MIFCTSLTYVDFITLLYSRDKSIKCNMDLLHVRRNITIIIQVNALQTKKSTENKMIFFLKTKLIQCKQLITCIPCERSNFTLTTRSRCAIACNKRYMSLYYPRAEIKIGKQLVWFMPIDESCSALRARSSK